MLTWTSRRQPETSRHTLEITGGLEIGTDSPTALPPLELIKLDSLSPDSTDREVSLGTV